MKHTLPELPFALDALRPHMSAETLEFHHGKHHRTYVDKLNQLIQGSEFENLPLEEIIKKSTGPVFNNAAQAWNHSFFWNCLTPRSRLPQGKLDEALQRDFGGTGAFLEKFSKEAVAVFGSGWAWLVFNEATGKLEIQTTSNADTPIRKTGLRPLLTCDVWEHAYYIDYRNERPKFLEAFSRLTNWEFAERLFEESSARLAA